MIKVLVVDDSAVVRQIMQVILGTDRNLQVETASDPIFALRKIAKEPPDVLITDLEMPRMDGIEFIRRIMRENPMPVIVCSGLAEKGTFLALQALDLGAIEIIAKPKLGVKDFLHESAVMLIDAVYSASLSHKHTAPRPTVLPPRSTAVTKLLTLPKTIPTPGPLIVLGASTGGVEALTCILKAMPADIPPILAVQHMPEHFTRAFAERLNTECAIEVHEASEGQRLHNGLALIARGNFHMMVRHDSLGYITSLDSGPMVSRHRPSVDVLFHSAARAAGRNAIGVILTGMGDDGARALLEMRQAGAQTIAEDKSSCVVFGMPCEAIRREAVEIVLPLTQIAPAIINLLRKRFR